ncbi:NAD(P)-dependent oxidoreductase [Anaeromyxobacter oryzae]|uniref:3-hydroxyisobutyrate dehydrogenase n=1 Tax=Anaeromyxobacter oryzae TaxID=2918170 RepID=A0ABN6MRS4_9BACT|nr:NAD(P)-binding domain-containing protein [Anaeromyxobacter oryzae]BDG02418.1 3-hydroxyisobutyrate dehydrogenase [Anaeromyxobacter oryzae]
MSEQGTTAAEQVAFLGTGLLGGNFVRALRRRGVPVRCWNRSPEKARALASTGAVACDDPADAVRGAARVHLALSDDAAVDDVLDRICPGLAPGAILVDHTTTSPAGTIARAARWEALGVPFQHAPVFMGPQNALEGTGLMLASGPRARFEALAPALAPMTGRLEWLGPQVDRAAALKLVGNCFLMAMSAGLVDALALGKSLGVPPAEAGALFELFNPGTTVPARVKRILAARHDRPSWTLDMARKDARLMTEAAGPGAAALMLLPVIAAAMDRAIGEGLGGQDWMVISRGVTG